MSEARILRDRLAAAQADADRRAVGPDPGGRADLVQTTAVGTYPTVAASYFACVPLRMDGAEAEGGTASFTADSSRVIFAFNLGSKVPPLGTKILAFDAGGRWVMRHDG